MKRLLFVALVASASIFACETPDSTTGNEDTTTPVTTDTMMNNSTDTSTIVTDTTGMGSVTDTTGLGR